MRGTPASSRALAAAAPSAVSEKRMSPISALKARFDRRSGGVPGCCSSPGCSLTPPLPSPSSWVLFTAARECNMYYCRPLSPSEERPWARGGNMPYFGSVSRCSRGG